MNFTLIDKMLKNISKTNNEDIQGIVLVHTPKLFDVDTLDTIDEIAKINKETKDYGFHILIDNKGKENEVHSLIDLKYRADFLKGKATYISKALFSQQPNGRVIYVYIQVGRKYKYEETEEKLIKFLVFLLRKYKLTAKDVWRGFDLDNSDYSPLHLLDKNIFEKYITEIEKFIPPVKSTLEGVNGNPAKFIDAISNACIESYKVEDSDSVNGSSSKREVKLASKIKALELLGKHVGMWNDRIQVDVSIPVFGGEDKLED